MDRENSKTKESPSGRLTAFLVASIAAAVLGYAVSNGVRWYPVVFAAGVLAAVVPGGYLRRDRYGTSDLGLVLSLTSLSVFVAVAWWAGGSPSLTEVLIPVASLWIGCNLQLLHSLEVWPGSDNSCGGLDPGLGRSDGHVRQPSVHDGRNGRLRPGHGSLRAGWISARRRGLG
jgi:hypothetical protein